MKNQPEWRQQISREHPDPEASGHQKPKKEVFKGQSRPLFLYFGLFNTVESK